MPLLAFQHPLLHFDHRFDLHRGLQLDAALGHQLADLGHAGQGELDALPALDAVQPGVVPLAQALQRQLQLVVISLQLRQIQRGEGLARTLHAVAQFTLAIAQAQAGLA